MVERTGGPKTDLAQYSGRAEAAAVRATHMRDHIRSQAGRIDYELKKLQIPPEAGAAMAVLPTMIAPTAATLRQSFFANFDSQGVADILKSLEEAEDALADASLLFIGYRLRDINFRVIYRGLVQALEGSLRSLSVTVQMKPPDDHAGDTDAAEQYLTKYFDKLQVRVYWGTAAKFAKELRDRWRKFRDGNPTNS